MLTSVVLILKTFIIPHEEFLRKVDEAFDRSKEDFATSFRLKYTTTMPIWMCIELWDFGTLSNVLSGMRSDDLKHLADRYGLPLYKLLISWAQKIKFCTECLVLTMDDSGIVRLFSSRDRYVKEK